MNYNDAINIPTTAIRMVKASGSRNCPCVRHPHDISKCNTKKRQPSEIVRFKKPLVPQSLPIPLEIRHDGNHDPSYAFVDIDVRA